MRVRPWVGIIAPPSVCVSTVESWDALYYSRIGLGELLERKNHHTKLVAPAIARET